MRVEIAASEKALIIAQLIVVGATEHGEGRADVDRFTLRIARP